MVPIHTSSTAELSPINDLMIQLLEWFSSALRTYSEAMEAWRSSCPRMSVWEDALAGGLIRVSHTPGTPMNDCGVELTDPGLEVLARHVSKSRAKST